MGSGKFKPVGLALFDFISFPSFLAQSFAPSSSLLVFQEFLIVCIDWGYELLEENFPYEILQIS